ncbi:outer membrane beta-barrel protein [Sphingobacterium oryzagri]|uniref:Outer membrane beta-barrel protein n=1 Tax=Sphingobacterium oryzagri TaxID=3025669 RepID=A0ABY7WJE3_9SPHI|nr:outer membrane beta-barrel protein [Sphingobacterium sp. KACC 22765]WDF69711.1 outer membrane beta-barrel protein [Sphingobacterium sp. KACC 22765]
MKIFTHLTIGLFSLLLLSGHTAFAQLGAVRGVVRDTMTSQAYQNASVVLLNQTDSFLIADSRTDSKGEFELKSIKPGTYILMASYPKRITYFKEINIALEEVKRYDIALSSLHKVLEEVIVTKDVSRFKMNGDTAEFNASAYNLSENANVEDLVRQFPGIQIDNKGRITAFGKTVEKVLVDGEEFFSEDPVLITRNLKADLIDKVQIYQKQSAQSEFTGIKDDNAAQTINLKLKEDRKNGYFGKLEAGKGTEGFNENQGMFNYFRDKLKAAGYLTVSNTAKIGLDQSAQMSYAEGNDNPIANSLDTWDGSYSEIGLPSTWAAGGHFSDKWRGDRDNFRVNLRSGRMSIDATENNLNIVSAKDRILTSESSKNFNNRIIRHGGDIYSNFTLDSLTSIRINLQLSQVRKRVDEVIDSHTFEDTTRFLNSNLRQYFGDTDLNSLKNEVLFLRKLRRPRRTFSLSLSSIFNKETGEGKLFSETRYNSDYNQEENAKFDQTRTLGSSYSQFSTKISYTEPITTFGTLVFDFGANINVGKSQLLAKDNDSDDIDSLSSSNYQLNRKTFDASVNYVFDKNQIRLVLGGATNISLFSQQNLMITEKSNRKFFNLFPKAEIKWSPKSSTSLSLRYNGQTIQPTLEQLQPLRNNLDPLNVFIGNPTLNQSFSNTVNFDVQDFQTYNMRLFLFGGSMSMIKNPINISTNITSEGVSTYTYVNNPDLNNLRYSGYLNYSVHMKKLDMGFGLNATTTGNIESNFIEGVPNRIKQHVTSATITLTKQKADLYNTWLTLGPNFTSNNSQAASIVNTGWGASLIGDFSLYLPLKMQFNVNFDYLKMASTNYFNDNLDRLLINSYLQKSILKKNNLLLKLSVNDLLNQNVGFSRGAANNIVYQRQFNTIRRYVMVSLAWDFNKTLSSNGK